MYADRFLTGTKNALLTFAVAADRVQIIPSGPWKTRDDVENGQQVYSVNHSGMTLSVQGGLCSIRALPSKHRLELQIIDIMMVDCARLSENQIVDLGLSPDEFYTIYGHQVSGVRGWLIYAIPIASHTLPIQ